MLSTCCFGLTSRTWPCSAATLKSAASWAASASLRGRRCARTEAVGLSQRLAQHHGGSDRDVERAAALEQGNAQAGVGQRMNGRRHAGTLAAKKQRIVVAEGK